MENMLVIKVPAEMEDALAKAAQRHGITPEGFVIETLKATLTAIQEEPRLDAWEATLLRIGVPAGVSLSDEATSRETLYD